MIGPKRLGSAIVLSLHGNRCLKSRWSIHAYCNLWAELLSRCGFFWADWIVGILRTLAQRFEVYGHKSVWINDNLLPSVLDYTQLSMQMLRMSQTPLFWLKLFCQRSPKLIDLILPYTDVCIALYTRCFPSVCGKDFTGDSGGIRTHDLLLTSADVLTSRPPSLPDDDRPARILYSSGFRDIYRLMKFLRRVINNWFNFALTPTCV